MYSDLQVMLYSLAMPLVTGGRRWGVAVALGGVYVAAEYLAFGWPGWEPHDSKLWFIHAVALATIIGLVCSNKKISTTLFWLAAFGLMIGAVFVTTRNAMPWRSLLTFKAAMRCLGLSAAWLLMYALYHHAAQRVPARTITWTWVVTLFMTAALVFCYDQEMTKQCLIMAMASTGVGLACSFRSRVKLAGPPTLVLAMLLGMLLLNLYLYDASKVVWTLIVIPFVPLLGWLRITGPIRRQRGIKGNMVVIAIVFVVMAAAIAPRMIDYLKGRL